MNLDFTEIKINDVPKEHQTVVRLRTTYWSDRKGIYSKKAITYLQRKSFGYNCLQEESSAVDEEYVVLNIINLDTCKDGVYEVIVCDVSRDYETGLVDNWSFKLVPYCDE